MSGTETERSYQMVRQFIKLSCSHEWGRSARIAAAVSSELTERQRELVELYYGRQMTMQEIADGLGVNVATVSRTLKRARRRLGHVLRFAGPSLLESMGDDDYT